MSIVPDDSVRPQVEPKSIERLMLEVRRELSEIRREQVRFRECAALEGAVEGGEVSKLMTDFSRRVKILSERVAGRDLTIVGSRDIREPETIATLMAALGNEERVRILAELDARSVSFNELELAVGKKGGTLKYHLNQLESAGYLTQEHNRGRYSITVEGKLAYRMVVWLTSCISPLGCHNV